MSQENQNKMKKFKDLGTNGPGDLKTSFQAPILPSE